MKTYFQRMARSLMLPVSVLPAAALLEGIGHWLPQKWAIAQFLMAGGNSILGILALLFAIGLACGMSKNNDGASAMAGAVSYFVVATMLSPKSVSALQGIKLSRVNPAFAAINNNVFIGILAGLIAATIYNRFYEVQLPDALSFFSGKRLVPILSAIAMLALSVILLFVWPTVYGWLVAFGEFIVHLGAVGAGLYGFFNRLLIPTGLHQALNSVFWFNVAGINDLGNFWANKGTKGVTGMYMAGFFPILMFGLPAGAYAIYRNARPENKKKTGSLMLAGAFASFFTGVSEPIEFSFMFVAWPLYLIHAVLTGLSLYIAAAMHWTAGFTFSAGFVDFILGYKLPIANKPYMIIVQGIVFAFIYYFTFDFAIKKFNLMTPGREKASPLDSDDSQVSTDASDDKNTIKAKRIYAALGGYQNLKVVDYCTTRLRLQVKDSSKINQAAVKAAGAVAVNVLDKNNVQIIIGTDVQFVADPLKKLFDEKAASDVPVVTKKVTEPKPPKITSTLTDTEDFYTVAKGQTIALDSVSDSTFAQKLVGDGFAIKPTAGEVVAPVDGKISMIAPTKHAIGITTADDLEILIHMGFDTVDLGGKPFTIAVKQGQEIHHGEKLAEMDIAQVKASKKDDTIVTIVTNMNKVAKLNLDIENQTVRPDEKIMSVSVKN